VRYETTTAGSLARGIDGGGCRIHCPFHPLLLDARGPSGPKAHENCLEAFPLSWVGLPWQRCPRNGNAYLYDPSSADKIHYTAAVKAALAKLGLSGNLPYFAAGGPLVLQIKLVCPCPVHAIQAFPHRKDLDNMVKFLMDACHVVLYQNDTVVAELVPKKVFPPIGSVEAAWTEVHFSTI
jgi:Holliday junction resolvase RusA-like endonuclease